MLHLLLLLSNEGLFLGPNSLSIELSLIYKPEQEGLAGAFGNGLSTACVVNMGAQVTSVICIEVIFLFDKIFCRHWTIVTLLLWQFNISCIFQNMLFEAPIAYC